MPVRACPVCNVRDADLLYRREFEPLLGALLRGYDVVACRSCGFCFADGLPDAAEFERYYEAQSKYEHAHRGGTPSEYDSRRLPTTAALIAEWMPDRGSRIVDIGCANGGLLASLRELGYANVSGVDPSPACARTAGEHHGISVHVGSLSRLPEHLGPFDLAVFGSVLEHVPDLGSAVAQVERILAPAGRVFAEVPDVARCTLNDDAPFQEFSVEHVNFFSTTSLANLWRRHGFSVVGLRATEIPYARGLFAREAKGMFRRGASPAAPTPDVDTAPELRRYIRRCEETLARVAATIALLADAARPVIVWGVGTHTQGLLASTRLGEVPIAAWVDSNARYTGLELRGVPILSPDALAGLPHPVLVSSHQFQDEITREIRQVRGLPNELITLY